LALTGLADAFGKLYDRYNEPAFREAAVAVAHMGLTLPLNQQSQDNFVRLLNGFGDGDSEQLDPDYELTRFQNAVLEILKFCDSSNADLTKEILQPAKLKFEGLRRLLVGIIQRNHAVEE
jgi:hypothetical protein